MLPAAAPGAAGLNSPSCQPENTSYPGMSSVSPDGRYLTFSAVGPEGKRMLWLRPLDALHATLIQGSEGASAPFWSPDSQSIAFFGGKFLMKVKITGGTPGNHLPGGSRARRRFLESRRHHSVRAQSLRRLLPCGRQPAESRSNVLKLDESKSERADLWPQFLPDGKHFVFYQQTDLAETSGVYVGSLDRPEYHRLFASQTNAVYSAASPDSPKTGYLLYINERNLMAQQFNAGNAWRSCEEPVTLANDIGAVNSLALAPISVSATGVLVYQGVGQPTRQLVWMDRAGKQIAAAGEPGDVGSAAGFRRTETAPSSPRPAPTARPRTSGCSTSAGPRNRLRTDRCTKARPSGRRTDRASPTSAGRVMPTTSSRAPRSRDPGRNCCLRAPDKKFPSDWSHDGKYILYSLDGAGTRLISGDSRWPTARAAPILDTVYAEASPPSRPTASGWHTSPTSPAVTKSTCRPSTDSTTAPSGAGMVSKGGGLPRWRFDSGELFYMTTDGRIMSVSIHLPTMAGSKPARRRCSSRRGRFPRPGTSTTFRRTASASWSTSLGMDQRRADHGPHQLDRKAQRAIISIIFSTVYA